MPLQVNKKAGKSIKKAKRMQEKTQEKDKYSLSTAKAFVFDRRIDLRAVPRIPVIDIKSFFRYEVFL